MMPGVTIQRRETIGSRIPPSVRQTRNLCCHVAIKVPDWVNEVSPRGDHVYVRVQDAEEQTMGGVLLPGSAQQRPTSGQVVSLGDGRTPAGKTTEFTVSPGDEVLFSKFGFAFTELDVGGDEFLLMKERDIIGVMPKANAIADDIPDIKPLADRILVKITTTSPVTSGGVLLPDSAQKRPESGVVVRTGPGKREEDGSVTPPSVVEGDKIVYFKYAGDAMETTDGTQYVVLHEQDILCKT